MMHPLLIVAGFVALLAYPQLAGWFFALYAALLLYRWW